jgi:hypothetical protein
MAWCAFEAMLLSGHGRFLFFFLLLLFLIFQAHVSYGVAAMASIDFFYFSLYKII